jgi:hypothetical protein
VVTVDKESWGVDSIYALLLAPCVQVVANGHNIFRSSEDAWLSMALILLSLCKG